MNNLTKYLFMYMLVFSTLITISANSWFSAWMGLEINLLSFIPLMSDNNLMSNESSLKYFLTQAFASSILLFSIIIFLNKNNFMNNNQYQLIKLMIFSVMLMKTGVAPFHYWFPNVIEGLNWTNSLILMTWQKIAPLTLMSYSINKTMLMICIIFSSIIGTMGGLNQTSLRKLMAFSSINHLSWLLISMYISKSLWMMYFLMYSFLCLNIILLFKMFNLFHLNQLFNMFNMNKILKFCLFLNFLSLGGLPPFLGFFPKWIVIQQLNLYQHHLIMTIMIIMTLITLFFYLRMCYSTFMLTSTETNWIFNLNVDSFVLNWYLIISFISIFGLMLITMFYYFF
nr:NADH dehydrogenase subunit 2 [Serichlamys sp. ECU1]